MVDIDLGCGSMTNNGKKEFHIKKLEANDLKRQIFILYWKNFVELKKYVVLRPLCELLSFVVKYVRVEDKIYFYNIGK